MNGSERKVNKLNPLNGLLIEGVQVKCSLTDCQLLSHCSERIPQFKALY